MKCYVWKPCSDQHWQDKLWFSIWRFFEQSAFANIHLLCYWPTIHNSISKICPKFQVISSHFFEVDELLDEHWAKIVQSENISSPIYVECNQMYQSKVCNQESRISCLALIFNLRHRSTTVLYAKKWVAPLQVAKYDESCTFFRAIDTKQWLSWYETMELDDMGSIPDECWNDQQRPGHFVRHWARQCTDTRAFCIAALSIIFFFLDFVSGDLALTEL